MKIFIDTANINEIREIASWGILSGVTTNPSLVAKEGKNFKDVVMEICSIVDGPISAEVISPDAEGMIKEAREFSQWHKNIIIKIPMTPEGLKAVSQLSKEGIRTNVTLVFSTPQALLASLAGASFISPFVGRVDDTGWEGMECIHDIVQMIEYYEFPVEVISASIRNPIHVLESLRAGAHIATIPYNIIKAMAKHPLTDIGVAKFMKDWEKIPK